MIRKALRMRPLKMLFGVVLVVALACGGDAPTPTSPPTATKAPVATATTAPVVAATTAPVVAATTAPSTGATAAPAKTSTPVPVGVVDQAEDFVNYLLGHPGYQPEWGTPKEGGILKQGSQSRGFSRSGSNYPGMSCCINGGFWAYNSLLMTDPWQQTAEAGILCDLCETWSISDDGLTIMFKLREGVLFHDEGVGKAEGAPGFGEEMTCADAKYSMEYHAFPPEEIYFRTKSYARAMLGWLDNVECPDGPEGYVVQINADHFSNAMISWLAVGWPIWNKEYKTWMDKTYPGIQSDASEKGWLLTMGTGPYIYESMSTTIIKAKKNPEYFRKGGPLLDGVHSYALADPNTKFASFITGKIHLMGPGSSSTTKGQVIELQLKYPEYHILEAMYNHIYWFAMNPDIPPFDNWKVRWAFHIAFDREEWDFFATAGAIKLSGPAYWLHPMNSDSIAYEVYKDFPGYNQANKDDDIALANTMLDEVFGPGERPTLPWDISSTLSRREPGLYGVDFIQAELGITLDVRYIDGGDAGRKLQDCVYLIQAEAAPVHGSMWVTDASDAFLFTRDSSPWRHEPGQSCYNRAWKGTEEGLPLQPEIDRIDKLINEQDRELDPAKRREIIQYLEKYMVDERTTASALGVMRVVWPFRPEVSGGFWADHTSYTAQRLFDRVWFNN